MESMEKIKRSRILVTGGAGFIGSHVVEQLISLGADIHVVDIKVLKKSYFDEQKFEKKVTLSFVDIAKKNKIKKIFSDFKPDYVLHIAAEAIVNNSYKNPYKTFQTNIMGTVSILEAARSTNSVKGIIVASSDKAYGKTKKAYTESSPLQGDHPYDVSKSATDLIAQTYFKTYGLPIVVTRFGNVYGEGDLHLNRIIPGISEAIVTKKPLLIRSDGKYIRDYLYVKDVANGYIHLLKNIGGIHGEAYNFSSPETLSVLDVLKKAEDIVKVQVPYKILNTAKNEIPYQHLDDTKIRKLGWGNKYAMKDVFPRIVTWYSKYLI
jgi:CDP-glucose 4,6-dehydratase